MLAIADTERLLKTADLAAALSIEGLLGTDRTFLPDLTDLRPHPGQAASARNLVRLLEGSEILASHREGHSRVQDAYSLRCAPQVTGAARDTLDWVRQVADRELDAAIDNPVILEDGRVASSGNFHGAPLALAADFLAIALADVGSIAERRTDRMLDHHRSDGLPPFLGDDPGVDSGMMIAHYSAAALVAENRRLAAPASVDSIPTSAMQEDHVSMGWAACRKLRQVIVNLRRIVSIELMTAARAVELRQPLGASPATAAAIAALRREVEGPGPDRFLHPEIEATDRLAASGAPGGRRRADDRRARMSGPRLVRASRGSELSCKGWQQEAALRCFMNNLDPEVAENPDELVVYGGRGRAARNWESFDAIVATLQRLENDETLLVQSGKPVGVFRTHEMAPRVLLANSMLVPDWATWEDFWRLEAEGLTAYGQMTAGSWIYIGTQGILQGTFQTFAAVADQRFGGSLRGRVGAHRRPWRHGWSPALGGDHERRRGVVCRDRSGSRCSSSRRGVPRRDRHFVGRRPGSSRLGPGKRHSPVDRRRGQRGRGLPRHLRARGHGRRRHRPDVGPRPSLWVPAH